MGLLEGAKPSPERAELDGGVRRVSVDAGPVAGKVVVKLWVRRFCIHGVESVEAESAEVRTAEAGVVEGEYVEERFGSMGLECVQEICRAG